MTPFAPPRLLIVDDEPICRRAVRELAAALGLDSDTAVDGRAGLEAGRERRYDLLLIDWRMPGMTGTELMQALRSDPQAASRDAVMVLVTGESIDFEAERLRGFDAVLAKPLTADQLRGLLAAGSDTVLPGPADPSPMLDDGAALAALGGNRELLSSLREMLAAELEQDWVRMPVQLAEGAAAALRERLHQLIGGARYCGAPALAAAADRLREAVKAGLPTAARWADFERTSRQTHAALLADRTGRS